MSMDERALRAAASLRGAGSRLQPPDFGVLAERRRRRAARRAAIGSAVAVAAVLLVVVALRPFQTIPPVVTEPSTASSTSSTTTVIDPALLDQMYANAVNQLGWQDVTPETWYALTGEACSSGAWDETSIHVLAQRFLQEQGLEGRATAADLPMVIWLNMHVLCPDSAPPDARPPSKLGGATGSIKLPPMMSTVPVPPPVMPDLWAGAMVDGATVTVSNATAGTVAEISMSVSPKAEGGSGVGRVRLQKDAVVIDECCEPAAGLWYRWLLATTDLAPGSRPGEVTDVDAAGRLLIVDPNGFALRATTPDGDVKGEWRSEGKSPVAPEDAAWSPDASLIAFIGRSNEEAVLSVFGLEARGLGEASVLDSGPSDGVHPAFPAVDRYGRVWYVLVDEASQVKTADGGLVHGLVPETARGRIADPNTGDIVDGIAYEGSVVDQSFDASGTYLIVTYADGRVAWYSTDGGSGILADGGYASADWHSNTAVQPVTVHGTVICPDAAGTSFESDLDGDGRPETVVVSRPPGSGESIISVCGTTLEVEPFHVGDVNKPVEAFPMDVDADGVTELLLGAPTGGPIVLAGTVLRFDENRWADLGVGLDVTVVGRTGSSFGCVDVDDDGVKELVSETYQMDADTLAGATRIDWERTVVWDSNGTPGTAYSGSIDPRTDGASARDLVDGTCGDSTIVEAPQG